MVSNKNLALAGLTIVTQTYYKQNGLVENIFIFDYDPEVFLSGNFDKAPV